MVRKVISEEEKNKVKSEAEDILHDIILKWIPTMNIYPCPSIHLKFGGWTATADMITNHIRINFYSWRKMPFGHRRLLLIHELIHCMGWKHTSVKAFCHSLDLMTLMIYLKIYGKDKVWDDMMSKIEVGIQNLENNNKQEE